MMRLLRSLNILDDDNTLCLSHLALFACLVLLVIDPGWEKLTAFGVSILNYNAKKMFAYVRSKKELKDMERLDSVKGEMEKSRVHLQREIDRLQHEFEKINAALTFKSMRQ